MDGKGWMRRKWDHTQNLISGDQHAELSTVMNTIFLFHPILYTNEIT